MNTRFRPLIFGVSWVLALGIGLLIGRNTSPTNEQASQESSHIQQTTRDRPSSSRDSPDDTSELGHLRGSNEERRAQARSQLAEILNTSDRLERTRQLLNFIDRLDPNDFESVVSGFSEAGWVDFNRNEFSLLLSSWMNQDPYTALDYLQNHEPDGWARKTAIAAWAAENPEAAAAAIEGLEDGGRVNDWIVGLVQGIARNDPQSALSTLQQLPPSDTRNQAIRSILPDVVSRGAEFAGTWIETIDDPDLQRDTAKRLGRALARHDPESASDWIRGMTTVDSRRDASEIVSDIFAASDLDAARKWAESLPHDTMTEAAEGVAKHMARKDPSEAAQWLQQLGNDPDLDGARILFIRESTQRDPQVALENIHTLSRPAEQERYYRHVLRNWKRNNQEAAVTWAIENSEILSARVYNSIVPKERRASM